MKDNIHENRFYITCTCHDPSHLLCFDIYDDEKNIDISVYFTGNWKAPWYKRIWYALNFIFQKKPFCWNDDIDIHTQNIHELEEVIDRIKQLKNG